MNNSGDMFFAVYLSEGSFPFSEKDLRELLTKSRENNSIWDLQECCCSGAETSYKSSKERRKLYSLSMKRSYAIRGTLGARPCSKATRYSGTFPIGPWVFMT
jgi:hypothetical protein